MNDANRLRYEITDWSQVTECLSNNSRDLHMRYIEISDEDLVGKLILVEHTVYGILFSCLVEGDGAILTPINIHHPSPMHVFRLEDILMELDKFGFDIRFKKEKKLTGEQLEYLVKLSGLGFEKLRMLTIVLPYVPHQPKYRQVVVGFVVSAQPKWLDNRYQCPESEFLKAIEDGTAINLTAISKPLHFDWSFLKDYVLSISDILAVNS